MQRAILVVTATTSFGASIRETLEGGGLFYVTLVDNGCDALERTQARPFAAAILDAEVDDITLSELGATLLKLAPAICLLVVPPGNDPANLPSLSFKPAAYLTKPLGSLELLNSLAGLGSPQPAATVEPASTLPVAADGQPAVKTPAAPRLDVPTAPLPDWLQDVNRAAQHLTSLSLESSAPAALIIREGILWAYAGQLPQPAVQELTATVTKYWDSSSGRDLARFVHLEAAGSDYMLYATRLSRGMVLALAFEAETPFSQMRAQASQLARELSSSAGPKPPQALPSPTPPATPSSRPPTEPDIRNLLADVPPPTVGAAPEPKRTAQPDEHAVITLPPAPQPARPPAAVKALAPAPPAEPQVMPMSANAPDPTADLPEISPDVRLNLQAPTPTLVNLSFACMMIPRLPDHHLTGDLAMRLSEWVAQLCLAFGWRLEHLAVRPDYIQWVVNVPPATSPSYLMRVLRQQTSQRIFTEFPSLARANPSGDFWAPGYLIMSSPQPPPAQVVKDFIQSTRQHQGVVKPSRLNHSSGSLPES
jgi:REP element-mobilizing transposase RayT/CheY-like chemotaxis protein